MIARWVRALYNGAVPILRVGAYPVICFGTVTLGAWRVPAWGPQVTVAVFTALAGLVLLVLERVLPYRRVWNVGRGDLRTDLLHTLVSMVAVPELLRLTILAFAGGAVPSACAVWPTTWHWSLQLALGLVVGELGLYWVHRLGHQVPALWRLHATHHSAERVYLVNSGRFHPLDAALAYVPQMVPLVLLGCPADTLALVVLFTAVHGMFQHANVDARLGPLNWVFAMGELHRWHHSKRLAEANTNYGANLILWDVVFRTRFLPATEPPVDVGIADMPDFPRGYLQQLASPWTQWPGARGA